MRIVSDPDRAPTFTDSDQAEMERMERAAYLTSFFLGHLHDLNVNDQVATEVVAAWAASYWTLDE